MLKAALKKQEIRKKNHVLVSIFEHIKTQIDDCKKRDLRKYEVPMIMVGYPRYETHDLYKKLKSYYRSVDKHGSRSDKKINGTHSVNIVDGQITIEWGAIQKKKHEELNIILTEINNKIEMIIDNDMTELVYDVPIMIAGIPLYNFEKTITRIMEYLNEDGFFVIRLAKAQIGISWKTAELIRKKPKKNKFKHKLIFKEPDYEKSIDDFSNKLEKLKKRTHKLQLGGDDGKRGFKF